MRALLVGGGAREHAIADALFRSGAELIVAMYNQNPGILKISKEWFPCPLTLSNRKPGCPKISHYLTSLINTKLTLSLQVSIIALALWC